MLDAPDSSTFFFVVFDSGFWPDALPVLTVMEELIVAVLRVHRVNVIARPANADAWRTRDTYSSYVRGHVVAVPNPPLTHWQAMLTPLDPDSLAEHVTSTHPGRCRAVGCPCQVCRNQAKGHRCLGAAFGAIVR